VRLIALQLAALAANPAPVFELRDLPAARGVSEDAHLAWYAVAGTTRAELRAQMHRLGPVANARTYDGMTRDHVRWHYTYGGNGTACWVSAARVTLTDTITLPRWTPPPGADPALLAEWWRYLSMLKRHEEGHRRIAFDGAARIAEAINRVSAQPTCDAVGDAANAAGHAILLETQTRQAAYDRATRHGGTQGAILEDVDAPGPRWLARLLLAQPLRVLRRAVKMIA
jgi:predicted secreted Zn-dependent protease